ncbi:hypothetical protein WICPIJ_000498 [Wickerhamomyces pijperi]|uniref:Uncharacterized protein n=1 Tax=Wickerhamomyces pijperi TaxID=599730 RepID=A0A9P8QCP3_WICPI|nr:hypothetical protein WICPIJ_000498 [Wickerhamomyces pijperi]
MIKITHERALFDESSDGVSMDSESELSGFPSTDLTPIISTGTCAGSPVVCGCVSLPLLLSNLKALKKDISSCSPSSYSLPVRLLNNSSINKSPVLNPSTNSSKVVSFPALFLLVSSLLSNLLPLKVPERDPLTVNKLCTVETTARSNSLESIST